MATALLTLGDRLRIARKRAGFTLEVLGERITPPMSIQQLAAWEGDVHDIRVNSLDRIAAALGTTASEILGIEADDAQ